MFDLARVRSQFPGLSEEWALFDNAGGSLPVRGVIDSVRDYMTQCAVQLGASYPRSEAAGERVERGRAAASRLLDVSADQIILGASSTQLVRLVARAMGSLLNPGDEIVVTDLDHECNIGAWRGLESSGIIVREWRFDTDLHALTLEGLEPLLGPRTRLVCFTHCSNIVGTLHDAGSFIRRIHAAGALACVDGVAFAPHRRVTVRELDADLYFLSAYKVFGPHLGVLAGRRSLLERLPRQNHFFLDDSELSYKLEPGGVPHELAASLPAIVDYLESLAPASASGDLLGSAYDAIAAHETALIEPLLGFLRHRRDVRLLGCAEADAARRVPTISFTVTGRRSSDIVSSLDKRCVATRYGHFYAYRAIERMGLLEQDGVVRVSLAHYNSPAEVTRLIDALDRVL